MKKNFFKSILVLCLVQIVTGCKQSEEGDKEVVYSGILEVYSPLQIKSASGDIVTLSPGKKQSSLYLTNNKTLVLVYDQQRVEIKAPIEMLPDNEGNIDVTSSALDQTFAVRGSKTDRVEEKSEGYESRRCNISIGKKTEWVNTDPNCVGFTCSKTSREIEMFREGTCVTQTKFDSVTTTLNLHFIGSKSSNSAVAIFNGFVNWTKNRREEYSDN